MTDTSSDAFIRLRGLTRSFPMGQTAFVALRGIDLDIAEGEFVAIVGPSGSGKSTLMTLLGCLDRPSGGSYHLGGREVARLSDRQRSRIRNEEIGFVFQQYHLLPDLNVVQNIALALVYGGARMIARRRLAESLAEQIGLGRHLTHRPNELSGGQMQRVAIARALAGRPRLILADEPTGNLDTATGGEILRLIRQLHREGHTVVLVTHDRDVAAQAQRVISLVDGRVVGDERKHPPPRPDGGRGPDGRALTLDTAGERAAGRKTSVSLLDVLRMALREGLLAKKVRTFLTMLGIVFGIAAVIAMNGITEGGKRRQLEQIRLIGLNNIQVRDRGLEGARLLRERRRNPYGVNRADLEALTEHLPDLDALTAWKGIEAELRCGDRVFENAQVLGVEGDFQEVVNFYVGSGRFLQAEDQRRHKRVCVAGLGVVDALAIEGRPVGQWIVIGDEPFRVVGVMGRKEFAKSEIKDLQIEDRNFDVYIPYSSLRTYFKNDPHDSHFDVVSMRMARDEGLLERSRYVHRIVAALHHQAEDFEVSVPLEKIHQAQQTKEVFNVIIVVIAAISLVVGGIGIMNIMLATVRERTREIGIRRAVGASRADVLHQFLAEALLISVAGGVLGLGVGISAGYMIEALFAFPVALDPLMMAVAMLVSMLVGIVFGIHPAWLAACMDPVEALRA